MGQSKRWTIDEDAILFAWLDFCIESEQDFFTTLKDHSNIDRPQTGVETRLRRVVTGSYKKDEHKKDEHKKDEHTWDGRNKSAMGVNDILEKGSKCLRYPSEELRLGIENELQNFRTMHKTTKSNRPPKVPTSKSKQPELGVQIPVPNQSLIAQDGHHKRVREQSTLNSFPCKKPCHNKNVPTTQLTNQAGHNSEMLQHLVASNLQKEKQHSLPKEIPAEVSSMPTRKEGSRASGYAKILPILGSSDMQTEQQQPTKSPDGLRIIGNRKILNHPPLKFTKGNKKAATKDSLIKPAAAKVVRDNLEEVLKQKNLEIEKIRAQWEKDRLIWCQKEKKLQTSAREYEAKFAHLKSAMNINEDPNSSLVEELSKKDEEIYEMRKRLIHQSNIEDTIRNSEYIRLSVINEAMEDIKYFLGAMVQFFDESFRLQPPANLEGDLDQLVNLAFKTTAGTSDGKKEMESLSLRLGSSALMNLLSVAALKAWVFLTDFPRIEIGNLSLLDSYRDIIGTLDGSDKLKHIEIAAYKEYMETSHFKKYVLRGTAENLACRLSKALSQLFSQGSDANESSFHSWGEDLESWEHRKYHYENLFQAALELKRDTVLTKDTYTFEFDLIDDLGDIPANEPKPWLRISFRAYSKQEDASDVLVQTRNFSTLITEDIPCRHQKDMFLVRESMDECDREEDIYEEKSGNRRRSFGERSPVCNVDQSSAIVPNSQDEHTFESEDSLIHSGGHHYECLPFTKGTVITDFGASKLLPVTAVNRGPRNSIKHKLLVDTLAEADHQAASNFSNQSGGTRSATEQRTKGKQAQLAGPISLPLSRACTARADTERDVEGLDDSDLSSIENEKGDEEFVPESSNEDDKDSNISKSGMRYASRRSQVKALKHAKNRDKVGSSTSMSKTLNDELRGKKESVEEEDADSDELSLEKTQWL